MDDKCVKESECKCYISDKCVTSGYEFVSRNCDRKCVCNGEGQFTVQVQSGRSTGGKLNGLKISKRLKEDGYLLNWMGKKLDGQKAWRRQSLNGHFGMEVNRQL